MAAAECIRPVHPDSGPSTAEMRSSSGVSEEFRTLTISEGQPYARRAIHRHVLGPAPFPFLRIRGRRMKEAGFEIGKRVRVQVMRGRLVPELECESASER